MKNLVLASLALACGVLPMYSQLYLTDVIPNLSSVSNEGTAVGSDIPNSPFFIWNPKDNSYTEIGGISAGDGIGGTANFSTDMTRIAAPMPLDAMMLVSNWEVANYPDFKDYTFTTFCFTNNYCIWAAGKSNNGEGGIILMSADNGKTWRRGDSVGIPFESEGTPKGNILCMSSPSSIKIYAGGTNGTLYYSKGSAVWRAMYIVPEDYSKRVATYHAIDFIYDVPTIEVAPNGVFGVEYDDNTAGIWYTHNGGESFQEGKGVTGIPVSIAHNSFGNFLLVTANGSIMQSDNNGEDWESIFELPAGGSFSKIVFSKDGNNGMAFSDNGVYVTKDAGQTWEKSTLLPSNSIDAVYSDNFVQVLTSTGEIFISTDNSTSFTTDKIDLQEGNSANVIFYNNNLTTVICGDGEFYRKNDINSMEGYGGGIYDSTTGKWTPLAQSGYPLENVISAPFAFSGDGNHVAGIMYNYNPLSNAIVPHACVWNGTESYTDLGSMYGHISRAARVNASNYDGTVLAGWQDIFGPWFGCIWKKEADGNYTQKLLYKNEEDCDDNKDYSQLDWSVGMSELLGECSSMSANGKWIGGYGAVGMANHGPYIWNEDEGVTIITDDREGYTKGVTNDGGMAVGYYSKSGERSAWIWHRDSGLMEFDQFAAEKLGLDISDYHFSMIGGMSPNERYIYGAVKKLSSGKIHGFVLDISGVNNAVERIQLDGTKASIYPNPASHELHIDLPFVSETIATSITLSDMQGRRMAYCDQVAQSNVMNVSSLNNGIYILTVKSGNSQKSYKIVVKH